MIDLDPGDVIISAIPMQDFILVFTQRGAVYKIEYRVAWDGPPRVTVQKL